MSSILAPQLYWTIPKLHQENYYELCYLGINELISRAHSNLGSSSSSSSSKKKKKKSDPPSLPTHSPECLVLFAHSKDEAEKLSLPLLGVGSDREWRHQFHFQGGPSLPSPPSPASDPIQLVWVNPKEQPEFTKFFKKAQRAHQRATDSPSRTRSSHDKKNKNNQASSRSQKEDLSAVLLRPLDNSFALFFGEFTTVISSSDGSHGATDSAAKVRERERLFDWIDTTNSEKKFQNAIPRGGIPFLRADPTPQLSLSNWYTRFMTGKDSLFNTKEGMESFAQVFMFVFAMFFLSLMR